MTMLSRLLAAALATAAFTGAAAAQSGNTNAADRAAITNDLRIVGGEIVTSAQAWPWQIALIRKVGKSMSWCGGSVIAQNWVLTAAHCVFSEETNALLPIGDFVIVEGTKRFDQGGRNIRIKRIVLNGYDPKSKVNDIALLELATPAVSTPIPLARPATASLEKPGSLAVVTGWGLLQDADFDNDKKQFVHRRTGSVIPQGEALDPSLRQVEVPLVGLETCNAAYKGTGVINATHICAGEQLGGKDACQGDSGGPLVVSDEQSFYVQIGVVSWGAGCAVAGMPGVYTRVASFDKWLAETTAIRQDKPSTETQTVATNALGGDNSAGVAVGFVQGTQLKIGQQAQFRVTTQRPGYLLLLDIAADGSLTQIYPNEASMRTPSGARRDANRVEPGRPLLVPNPANVYEGFDFMTEGPVGEGKLVAVLSDKPMKWLKAPQKPRSFDTRAQSLGFIAALGAALARDLGAEGPNKSRISIAVTPYTVAQ